MRRGVPGLVAIIAMAWVLAPPASAQGFGNASPSSQPFNDSGIRNGGIKGQPPPRPKPVLAPIPQVPDPWQRLDRGAMLCASEADLEQHQAAVSARLDGRTSPEPAGCRIVREMMAVSVLARHGPAKTEVSLPASAGQKTGWTDAPIPKDKPLSP